MVKPEIIATLIIDGTAQTERVDVAIEVLVLSIASLMVPGTAKIRPQGTDEMIARHVYRRVSDGLAQQRAKIALNSKV